jgi:hypothetical protein
MSTDINGFTTGSTTFTGPVSNGHDTDFLGFNLPGTFNASLHFDITTNGLAGESNTGAALAAAAVPGPIVGAGLPGLVAALGWLGFGRFRRKRS